MSCFSEMILEQDLTISNEAVLESPQLVTNSSKKRRITSKSGPKQNEENKVSDELRKTTHREIERQRRQEMSTLYASLRELLPLEYIKGKRSVSDHMHEAASYIKDMEKKIEELQLRRDELKNASASNTTFDLPNFVTVNCCCDGLEILINCGVKEGYGFSLSRVIVELTHNGLDVVTCISNKVNGRFLYKIHTQVNALAYINLAELQQRLTYEIN
ncbi:transcription factor bHLH36-like isoform X2 [Salvia miltiorrhiza]|uniref:transcription factor bHLH36-like isoform X2 n=1 Tax=Salvia miltiorrhiza TaxID=226208 RepID=UPI0025AD563F|nr:transcription factor bHLH36-like isoform X2 [Salvia miltiorrhiza]